MVLWKRRLQKAPNIREMKVMENWRLLPQCKGYKLCVSFPDRSEMIQQDKYTPTKKYVRIRFRGETLIRLSTIKFAKHYNLTSALDLVHGVRNQVLAVYLAKRGLLSCVLLWNSKATHDSKSSAFGAQRVTPR